jgi:hypothetical protein
MSMNERVSKIVRDSAAAFYEGRVNSAEAYAAIDRVANSAWNWYDGVLNDTREAFDNLVDEFISADVDTHRQETFASTQLRWVRDEQPEAAPNFSFKVRGEYNETKWLTLTPAQMDALIRVMETV